MLAERLKGERKGTSKLLHYSRFRVLGFKGPKKLHDAIKEKSNESNGNELNRAYTGVWGL